MNERISEFLKRQWVIPTSVGVAGFAAGLGVGYILAKRQHSSIVEEIEELKNEQLELDFERAEKDREFNHMIQEAAQVARELRVNGEQMLQTMSNRAVSELDVVVSPVDYHKSGQVLNVRRDPKDIVVEPPEVDNIFDGVDAEWNYEAELSTRTKDTPYILHRDEFFNEEMGFTSSTLTYYAGDDILTDELDVPIYNHSSVVGELKFGHGSGDPNVVYIRNERLKAEYEVLFDTDSYESAVLGNDVEAQMEANDLKHSRHTVPKFREE